MNPTYTVHQGLCYHLTTLLCLSPYSWGGAATHCQSLYGGYSLDFFWWGICTQTK